LKDGLRVLKAMLGNLLSAWREMLDFFNEIRIVVIKLSAKELKFHTNKN